MKFVTGLLCATLLGSLVQAQSSWRELSQRWRAASTSARPALAAAVSDAFLHLRPEQQGDALAIGAEATLLAGRTRLALELVDDVDLDQHDDKVLTVKLQALARLGRIVAFAELVRSQAGRRPHAVHAALRSEEARLLPLAANALRTGAAEAGRTVFEHLAALTPFASYRAANFALCLRQLGDLEAAERTYRKALEVAPEDASLWNDYGLLLRSMGRVEEALAAFRRGVDIDMALPEPERGRGPAITNLMHWEALYPGQQKNDPLPNALFSLARRKRAVMLQRLTLDVQLDRLQRAATSGDPAVARDRSGR